MSTQAAAPPVATGFAPSAVQERPKLVITGRIVGLGEPKTTQQGDGDYESIDLIFEPERGSRKVFPRMLFRPEMFSIGRFRPDLYTSDPRLAGRREGKKLTLGETFAFIYRSNVYPSVETNSKGERRSGGCSHLMALCGGTLEGVDAIAEMFLAACNAIPTSRPVGDLGFQELTPIEISQVLKSYLQAHPGIELAAIAKQSKDQSGQLKDQYELADWVGPFNSDTHERLVKRASKTEGKSGAERLVIGYVV